jgi:hypothetical protein
MAARPCHVAFIWSSIFHNAGEFKSSQHSPVEVLEVNRDEIQRTWRREMITHVLHNRAITIVQLPISMYSFYRLLTARCVVVSLHGDYLCLSRGTLHRFRVSIVTYAFAVHLGSTSFLTRSVIILLSQVIFQAEYGAKTHQRISESSEYTKGRFIDGEFSYGPISGIVGRIAHNDHETYFSGDSELTPLKSSVRRMPATLKFLRSTEKMQCRLLTIHSSLVRDL